MTFVHQDTELTPLSPFLSRHIIGPPKARQGRLQDPFVGSLTKHIRLPLRTELGMSS